MNSDLLISLLVETNCLFLAGWVLALVAAFVLSFPEKLWFAQRRLSPRRDSSNLSSASSAGRIASTSSWS